LTTPPPGQGWNGHQRPDAAWNTGPLYDDTGWHLDLSELAGTEAAPRPDPLAEAPSPEHGAFPFPASNSGNGTTSGNPGFDRLAASPAGQRDRPAGRHARHARPAEDWAAPPPPAYQPAEQLAPPPAPAYQPAEFDYPESSSPLAQYSYPDRPTYSDRPVAEPRGRNGYPDYPESASPLARYSYPDPPGYQLYAEPAEPPAPAPAPQPDPFDQYQQYEQYQQYDYYLPPAPQARPMNPTLALPSMMSAPMMAAEAPPAEPLAAETTGTQSASVLRSSGVMAVGTLGSRLTGFLRTIAQSYALGVLPISVAYNLSNTLPNVVYNLALGGILTSVIVPLIVNSKKRDLDRGEAYEQRMFTLVTALLLGVTVLATLAAVPIVHLYSGSAIKGQTEHLAVVLAFFFIPQIFFYGVSSLISAVLNTRGSFAAPMWTPIVNNFVVIGVLGLYVVLTRHQPPGQVTGSQLLLLGLGTTLGIVAQTAALVPALRRVGFRWHPRTDFHRAEVAEIGRMAGWMLCYIGATQVAFFVTTKVAGDYGPGVTYYTYSWLLFQLPYAVVGVSVITALLPRMSAHAAEGRLALVRADFSAGIRLASAIVVPCSLALAVLGPPIAIVFLAHGKTTAMQGHDMGVVFAVFCLGLLPYMIFQLQLRVFYSLHDSKTPALIGLATMSVNIVANLVVAGTLHGTNLIAGLGVGFGLANLLGTVIAWWILSRRMSGLDGRAIGSAVGRMYAATVPAALLALLMSLLVEHLVGGARSAALLAIVLGGGGALLVYVLFARSLRITELTSLSRTVLSRLGR
jgi:putative peptidoglycan lipid II flippase